jgi:hypothetical protein
MRALAAALALAAAPALAAPLSVEDDYPRARELAQKQGKLLFVDAWAPW